METKEAAASSVASSETAMLGSQGRGVISDNSPYSTKKSRLVFTTAASSPLLNKAKAPELPKYFILLFF
jgi:hypothetical protein